MLLSTMSSAACCAQGEEKHKLQLAQLFQGRDLWLCRTELWMSRDQGLECW